MLGTEKQLSRGGDADAQYNLGIMYDNGRGVIKDEMKAFALYLKAAEQGNASAQYNVGSMYYEGRGVLKSYSKARYWIEKAYENNDPKVTRFALAFWNKYLAD